MRLVQHLNPGKKEIDWFFSVLESTDFLLNSVNHMTESLNLFALTMQSAPSMRI